MVTLQNTFFCLSSNFRYKPSKVTGIHQENKPQKQDSYLWFTVSDSLHQFEGQGWENIGFNRLPDNAENTVLDVEWSLSNDAFVAWHTSYRSRDGSICRL